MIIEIENTSSPGASFTMNTNEVLLKTYEWICENRGVSLPFKEFRMRLQSEKGVNDNNNRNIYPLLKNGGLVSYENRGDLFVEEFYTKQGLAYVKTIETTKLIINADYSEEKKDEAIEKLAIVQQGIICDALLKIVVNKKLNYVEPFQNLIKFLLRFDKINKVEFAYLIYIMQACEVDEALENMRDDVCMYRCGELDIEVRVKVRNDINLREKTKSNRRKEGLGFLTSFGYFASLLMQAGLVEKKDGYYCTITGKEKTLEKLGGVLSE